MSTLSQLCAGALAVIVLADWFAPPGSSLSLRVQANPSATASASLHVVNRTRKGDRLGVASSADRHTIATVEVVGLRDAAVVYRARDGRILFRTDPLSNVTLIAKDVVLPEVTIRDTSRSPVRPVPMLAKDAPAPAKEKIETAPQPTAIPDGCDPAFSPLAVKANVTGRCVASLAVPTRLAALH